MGCFDDIIALRGACTDVTPTSGFYLDDADLYREEIEQYIQKPYKDVDSFVDAKISMASKVVASTVYTQFQHLYLSRSILSSERIGYAQDNLELKTGANALRGVEIELCNYDSFVDFYLSELSLFIDTSGATNVFVYDLIQNKLLDTISVTAVAGNITTVYPRKTYKSNRKKLHLFIGYNSTGINSYYSTVQQGACFSCKSPGQINHWLIARGAEVLVADQKIESNLTQVAHTSGISLNYSLNCNHEDWLCVNSQALAMAILFRTAGDIMNYALETSQRVNSRTNIDVESLRNKRDYYEANYQKQLESIGHRMRLPEDRICFICNDRTRVSYTM